jgi:hypothetical protein
MLSTWELCQKGYCWCYTNCRYVLGVHLLYNSQQHIISKTGAKIIKNSRKLISLSRANSGLPHLLQMLCSKPRYSNMLASCSYHPLLCFCFFCLHLTSSQNTKICTGNSEKDVRETNLYRHLLVPSVESDLLNSMQPFMRF